MRRTAHVPQAQAMQRVVAAVVADAVPVQRAEPLLASRNCDPIKRKSQRTYAGSFLFRSSAYT